ncbi:MAG: ATP-binding protein [Leptolyngbyaceae bacterium]|nr:ATP-binding protein [Leptolyngbyaceae bacterium]
MSFGALRGKPKQNSLSRAPLLTQAQAQATIRSRQKVLLQVVSQIRQASDWKVIAETTTQNIRQLLDADRVAIYRFSNNWSGDVQAESVRHNWKSWIGQTLTVNNIYLQNIYQNTYQKNIQVAHGHIDGTHNGAAVVISDAHATRCPHSWMTWLEELDTQACVMTPVMKKQEVWGLLTVFQHTDPRWWKADEIDFLLQAGECLGIALQQDEHLQRLQLQAEKLNQFTAGTEHLQEHAVQNDKMAGLGQLVAGIAHEINNPVNFIHGNLKYVKADMSGLLQLLHLYQTNYPDPPPTIQSAEEELDIDFIRTDLPKQIESMQSGSERIRQIVLSLRNFSRKDETNFTAVDIHECIDSTLVILQHRLKNTPNRPAIQVVRNYADLPLVECYCGQINQVFMNILSNAIDTLEERTAQNIKQGLHSGVSRIIIQTKLVDSSRIKISIIDNGLGMPASVKEKIFEPFFTTKEVGKGTGMGMSISYQVITEKHNGTIECYSKPNEGTEFIIHIPIQQHSSNSVQGQIAV